MANQDEKKELVLTSNEFAHVLDTTKGQVVLYVGPFKQSLSGTDSPVVMDDKSGRFKEVPLSSAIQVCPTAEEGSYIELRNPTDATPSIGANNQSKLSLGKKVNTKGPISLALWPGQVAKVIDGHRLRSNQYLMIRVYNAEEAAKNWDTADVKGVAGEIQKLPKPDSLYIGQLIVISGSTVSFYIPPTGLEVVPDVGGRHVRDAVTLERLEYCILLDESGDKRYVHGPDVVFPKPTETFVELQDSRKFRDIELNENIGIYVKVIEEYKDDDGIVRRVGDELFITGKEQRIYKPRKEHAVIRYGDRTLHYATAVPEGEGRYVLNKLEGSIRLEKGPQMLMPDPRTAVIVKRVLDQNQVRLWFPGNTEAERVNAKRMADTQSDMEAPSAARRVEASSLRNYSGPRFAAALAAGDEFQRKDKYTEPKTITLDTKYEGAVCIQVWTGYAVQVVSKSGRRRVVTGPAPILLEYDETLEVLTLSTGTPKDEKAPYRTVYLLTQGNKVSDLVVAETKDLVQVSVRLSYRVNFEGDPNKWFNVENYIKLMTDHCRSLIRGAIKAHGIEDVNNNSIQIIRDTILGTQEDGKRSGRPFSENGMRIYDVEVLDVQIGDAQIKKVLVDAQMTAVRSSIQVATAEQDLEATRRLQQVDRDKSEEIQKTVLKKIELSEEQAKKVQESERVKIEESSRTSSAQAALNLAIEEANTAQNSERLKASRATSEQSLEFQEKLIKVDTDAVKERLAALSPGFIETVNNLADTELAVKISEALGPMSLLGGKSVVDILNQIIKGTKIEDFLRKKTTPTLPK